MEVTLRQLDKLNSLLDGALKAGLNGKFVQCRWAWRSRIPIKTKRVRQRLITRFIRRRNWRTAFIVNWGRYIACATMFPTISPPNGADDENDDRASVCQETYEQAAIQFDDQVDVVLPVRTCGSTAR